MHQLTVWAPRPTEVQIEVLAGTTTGGAGTGARMPMTPSADRRGWWVSPEPLAPGTAYRFVLDGVLAPDPRSAWQPDGVHGPSVTVDHDAFAWTDGGWRAGSLARAVLYELHVGTFTPEGTYAGVGEHLDHLVDLGITHIELLPLATFEGAHGWGYDGVDLYAPHPAYGTPDDLKRLVDACHQRGLAVLLDVVYNHLGPVGNHLARFGPYFTTRYETPWGEALNLDGEGSIEVRRFLIDNALMWLRDYHLDGLRLDAVHALLDTSAIHVLEQLATEVAELATALDRPLVLIAENDTNDPRLVLPVAEGGIGLDAHWCDDVHHVLHTALTGERDGYYADYVAAEGFGVIERALRQGYVYDGRYSPARDHTVGRSPARLRGRQLVACVQNHDQIGNRARGERLHHLTSTAAQKVAAALLLTAPFVPLLFQGEEWAATAPFPYFADHSDPQLVEAVRAGRRAEFAAFGWRPEDVLDPESADTFALATLDWTEPDEAAHKEMLAWYRDLLALRRSTPDLLDDRLEQTRVRADAATRAVVVSRGSITVAANLSDETQPLAVTGDVLLCSDPPARHDEQLLVPALSVTVLRTGADGPPPGG